MFIFGEYCTYILFHEHHTYIWSFMMAWNGQSQPPGMRNNRPCGGWSIVSLPSSPTYQSHIPSMPTPLVPMLPSASNFLNQNQFPTQSTIFSPYAPLPGDIFHHNVPPHLQYNPYEYGDPFQFYEQPFVPPWGPPPPIPFWPLIMCPSPSFQEHTSAVSSKTLLSVVHIPLLMGQIDFGTWNDGVWTLILHLGYLGHIWDPPLSGLDPLPDCIPSYMPVLCDIHSWWPCHISTLMGMWQYSLTCSFDTFECCYSLIITIWQWWS